MQKHVLSLLYVEVALSSTSSGLHLNLLLRLARSDRCIHEVPPQFVPSFVPSTLKVRTVSAFRFVSIFAPNPASRIIMWHSLFDSLSVFLSCSLSAPGPTPHSVW